MIASTTNLLLIPVFVTGRRIQLKETHLTASHGIDILERQKLDAELDVLRDNYEIIKGAHAKMMAEILRQRNIHAKALKGEKQKQKRAAERSPAKKRSTSTAAKTSSSSLKRQLLQSMPTSESDAEPLIVKRKKKKTESTAANLSQEETLANIVNAPGRTPFPPIDFPEDCPYITEGIVWDLDRVNTYRDLYGAQHFPSVQAAIKNWKEVAAMKEAAKLRDEKRKDKISKALAAKKKQEKEARRRSDASNAGD